MGIEDPGWGRIIIVIFFIAILLGFLYFSKNKGKNLFSLSSNEFLKLDGTIALSNISKASVISAQSQRFLIVHGRGQNPSIILLDPKSYIDEINTKNDVGE